MSQNGNGANVWSMCVTRASEVGSINFDHALTMSECPPASTTCTYPCFSFASPLDTSRLPYLTLWTTFCALLGWQSSNLSVCGLHSHLSLSSLNLSLEFWEYGTYAPRMCTECISSALDGWQCLYPSWWVHPPVMGLPSWLTGIPHRWYIPSI